MTTVLNSLPVRCKSSMILCLVSAELFSFCNAMVPWLLVLLAEVYLLAHILSQTNFLLNYRLVYFESNFSIAWRLEAFILFFSRWPYSTSFWCLLPELLYLRIFMFHPLPLLFGVSPVLFSLLPVILGVADALLLLMPLQSFAL